MNKLFGVICAVACAIFTGCKSLPTAEGMYSTTYAIGAAAGMVANQTVPDCCSDDNTRNTVIEIINIVSTCIPETNQTFASAWTPIAQEHVDQLIADGKLDQTQGTLVMTAFSLVVKGVDYVFEVRYPKAKEYKELVVSAINGFSCGFLTTFKPCNECSDTECDECIAKRDGKVEYDVDAFEYLMAK